MCDQNAVIRSWPMSSLTKDAGFCTQRIRRKAFIRSWPVPDAKDVGFCTHLILRDALIRSWPVSGLTKDVGFWTHRILRKAFIRSWPVSSVKDVGLCTHRILRDAFIRSWPCRVPRMFIDPLSLVKPRRCPCHPCVYQCYCACFRLLSNWPISLNMDDKNEMITDLTIDCKLCITVMNYSCQLFHTFFLVKNNKKLWINNNFANI